MKMVFGCASVIDNRIVMDEAGSLFFNGFTGNLEAKDDKNDSPNPPEVEYLMRNF